MGWLLCSQEKEGKDKDKGKDGKDAKPESKPESKDGKAETKGDSKETKAPKEFVIELLPVPDSAVPTT